MGPCLYRKTYATNRLIWPARFAYEVVEEIQHRHLVAFQNGTRISTLPRIVMKRMLYQKIERADGSNNRFLATAKHVIDLLEKNSSLLRKSLKDSQIAVVVKAVIRQIDDDAIAKLLLESTRDASLVFDDKTALLLVSVLSNNVPLLRDAIHNGAQIEQSIEFFGYPLEVAAANGHVEVVREMLEYFLTSGHHLDLRQLADMKLTALRVSCRKSHEDVARLLLNPRYQLETSGTSYEQATKDAAHAQQSQLVHFMLENGTFNDLDELLYEIFWIATDIGNEELFEMAIDKGVDVNVKNECGDRALELAASRGYRSIVARLMDLGTDLQYPVCTNGALIYAVRRNHQAIVTLLLDGGADVNYCGSKGTPFTEAARLGNCGMMQLLLDRGADLRFQETSLLCFSHAVRKGQDGVIRFLAKAGVSMETYWEHDDEDSGPAPILDAQMHNQSRIETLLIELGATPQLLLSSMEKKLRKENGYAGDCPHHQRDFFDQ